MTKQEILEFLKGTEINSIEFEGLVYVKSDSEIVDTYTGKTIKPTAKQAKELMKEAFVDEFGTAPKIEDLI